MKQLMMIALALFPLACAGNRNATFADTPHAQVSEVCQSDYLGTNCVRRIDTQSKYDQCLVDHGGDKTFCELKFGGLGATGYLAPAPVGPSQYAGSPYSAAGYADPVMSGYARSASTVPPVVSKNEYEQDKSNTKKHLKALSEEVDRNATDIGELQDENGK